MTDHANAPTTPPPGPLPSTLPEDMARNPAETFAIGQALDGLSRVDRYLRGRCDAELAAAVAKMDADERKARDEFRQEMRERLDKIETTLRGLADGLLTESQKVISLREENRRANVARCDDCPIREAL